MIKYQGEQQNDELLDIQFVNDTISGSLGQVQQKLSYWIRFICVLAILIACLGLYFFSFLLLDELVYFGGNMYKEYWKLGARIGVMVIVVVFWFVRQGYVWAKPIFIGLLITVITALGYYLMTYDVHLRDGNRMPYELLIFLCSIYITGGLVFPTAFYAWKYAKALQLPHEEHENWEQKAQTAQFGLKAWRLGAITFLMLGVAFTPLLWESLKEYYN